MTLRFLFRMHRTRRGAATKNPEQTMRAFWRTLEQMAPRPKGGGRLATGLVREKP